MFTHVVFNISVTKTQPGVSYCILITTVHEQTNILRGIKL